MCQNCIRIVLKPTPFPTLPGFNGGIDQAKGTHSLLGLMSPDIYHLDTKMGGADHMPSELLFNYLKRGETPLLWSLPPNFHRDSNSPGSAEGVAGHGQASVSCKHHVVPLSGHVVLLTTSRSR